ncbi:hypothetical protein KSF78_0009698 [Schistosoma japonicum]|nr:hypothetical protein KSF78_0009698 [Schistosoma japonicum]
MRYTCRILVYKFNYVMKLLKHPMRKSVAILSRHLRVFSLFSCILWLLLIGAFLRTIWHLSYLVLNHSGYGNNINLKYYDVDWKPSIYTVPRLTDAMLTLWPAYIAKDIVPSSDITLVSFSSRSPFPLTSQLNSATAFDEREQYRVFLSNVLHGLITRLIWIYPSWKQSSMNQFYKKSEFYVGLAHIDLSGRNYNNDELSTDSHPRIKTFCLCNTTENLCTLPLLYSTTFQISRQSCSVYGSLIYEETVDLMAESLLSQGKTERFASDPVYSFSRKFYLQSDKSDLSKSSSPNKLTVWIDSLFILHIDMNYFTEFMTTVNNETSLDSRPSFINYPHINSFNDSNVNFSTYELLQNSYYFTSPGKDNYIIDSQVTSHYDDQIPINSASLLHQYTILLKNVHNKLSRLASTVDHMIDNFNHIINSMLLFMTTQNPNMLSYWSNETLISSSSCCFKPSFELLTFDSDRKLNIFNHWKDNYRATFYHLDNYCSSSDTMINILVNKPTIMMNAKLELLSLWNWFCSLTIFELKFISQFITCEYKGKNDDLQPVGLCDREKLSISSPDGIPVNQRNPLLLHRLKNIITYLPRPLTVNVVMHPLLEQIIQKMHLSTELCKLLDEFSLNKHG